MVKAKRLSVKQQAESNLKERGNRAGDMIRFFLDGGNDAKFDSHDDVAIMVLAYVATLIPEIAFTEVLSAAGFKEVSNGRGGTHIVKI